MRILFVCMIDSITAVRWVSQLRGTGWDVHVFPSIPGVPPHPEWRDVTLHDVGLWRPEGLDSSVRVAGIWSWPRGAYRASRVRERLGIGRDPARRLARVIRRIRPVIVHSLEMQHAGYLTLDAQRQLFGRFPTWIYSCWGSDLFRFGRQPEHQPRIREVLAQCNGLIADCRRDIGLAADMGFHGAVLGVFPGGGGFPVDELRALRVPGAASARREITVKGYHNTEYGGRALIALQALHRCADVLKGYDITVFNAAPAVKEVAMHMAVVSGLRLDCPDQRPHAEVMAALGRSRVALAVGTTDGTPNMMLEAMIMGALPVQSDTVSTQEWIDDGTNGLLVPPEDPLAIEQAIRRALSDDRLVDSALMLNGRRMRDDVDVSVVRPGVLAAYGRVAAAVASKK